jgi:tRNA A-37 threonylcarbamoyl transferase component Bud32
MSSPSHPPRPPHPPAATDPDGAGIARSDGPAATEAAPIAGVSGPSSLFADPPASGGPPSRGLGASEATLVGPGADRRQLPDRIGRYRIKRMLGFGGMGTVYEAVQDHPRRTVALKVMKPGIASRSALKRFEYESQVLARLRHPGIAQVYDAGTYGGDENAAPPTPPTPYFAMEYIPGGQSIVDYSKAKQLNIRQRLQLFVRVCDAVHHGHQKGVIHRDLKPANILIDSTSGETIGQPKVIDFGVARTTDSDIAVTTLQTDVGQLIGTLQYMSPEQCAADPADIDTRSDVYGLGVILYELLADKLPYDVTGVAVYDATRVVRDQIPARLTTINAQLGGDIETIVFKSLEKDRDRRYQSAAELARDINRYLSAEPISARRASVPYLLKVFARRNRPIVVAAGVVFLAMVVGIVVTSMALVRARAVASRGEAAVRQSARELGDANLDLGRARLALEQYEDSERALLTALRLFSDASIERQAAHADTLRALINLYTAWGKPEKAAEYRTQLDTIGR